MGVPLKAYSSTGAPQGRGQFGQDRQDKGVLSGGPACPDVPALPHSVVGQTAPLLRQAAHGSDGEAETLPTADRGHQQDGQLSWAGPARPPSWGQGTLGSGSEPAEGFLRSEPSW